MQSQIENSFESAAGLIIQAKKRIEEIAYKEGLSGIATGFEKLDKVTCGFQPSDLIVIAGRPSMGKSAFALSMIRNVAVDFEQPVAFFSPEMSSSQIMNRLISSETSLSLSKLMTGKLEKHEWAHLSIKTRDLEKAPIYIDDSPNLSIEKLTELTYELVNSSNVKMVVIDNLHLLSSGDIGKGNFTREQELSTIVRSLKKLARELHIPIVLLAQLSREPENRGNNKRPILSDLRGSGTIEEIADIVSFIYRPEYYKIEEWDDDEQLPTEDQAEFIIAKHRNGSLENIRLKFIESLGKFDNLEDFNFPIKMNHDDNPFQVKNLPSANEAFGSSANEEDNDVPF